MRRPAARWSALSHPLPPPFFSSFSSSSSSSSPVFYNCLPPFTPPNYSVSLLSLFLSHPLCCCLTMTHLPSPLCLLLPCLFRTFRTFFGIFFGIFLLPALAMLLQPFSQRRNITKTHRLCCVGHGGTHPEPRKKAHDPHVSFISSSF